MNRIILTLLLLNLTIIYSQKNKTCKKEKPLLLDLNSIVAKCSIDDKKDETSEFSSRNSKRVSIQVSPRRKRMVRKNKKKAHSNSIDAIAKLASIKRNSSLVGKLNLNEQIDKLPFDFVDKKPMFSNCENKTEDTKCFYKEILNHVQKNFKYPEKSYENSIQGRVLVQFVIDEYGNTTDIITRGPYKGEELEDEAKRIIKKLPKFKPGKIGNNVVKVKFGIPITFKIPGRKPTNIKEGNKEVALSNVINFSKVQEIPSFKKCSSVNTKDKLDCFNQELIKHIEKYFVYPEVAYNNKIEGKVYTYFVIDKNGEVMNIKTRGPKNGKILEAVAKEMVSKLPKFIPGKENGKPVNVKYAFPINFKLN